jgi:thioredoxin reductase
MTETLDVDVVVIGGGAAGLSAALVLGRARRNVLVIDSGSPRNAAAAHMHGFLSRDGFPPSAGEGSAAAIALNADLVEEDVRIEVRDANFEHLARHP